MWPGCSVHVPPPKYTKINFLAECLPRRLTVENRESSEWCSLPEFESISGILPLSPLQSARNFSNKGWAEAKMGGIFFFPTKCPEI